MNTSKLKNSRTRELRIQNSKFKIIFCLLSFPLCLLAGCGAQSSQSSPDLVRRAQIVGNENIQLKKTLAEKDARIADLNKQLDAAKAENDRIQEQHGESYTKLLQILTDCQTKLEKYEQQN